MLSVLLLCSFLRFLSAQYDSERSSPLQFQTFQPIPVILKFPDGMEHDLRSLHQYSLTDDVKPEANGNSVPLTGINDFSSNLRRYDNSFEVPNKVGYGGKGARNLRYQEPYESIYSKHPGSTRDWQASPRNSDQRRKRPRYSSRKDSFSVHRNILRDEKLSLATEVRRSPRVVTYIADQNGFALREDLVRPFQETVSRSRRKSRILTSESSPLMAKVVTTAIQVANNNNQPSPSPGKYLPQIIDLKVGK